MKKILLLSIVLIMLITGCGKKQEKPEEMAETYLVKVETEGVGEIACAYEGKELKFSEDIPTTAYYANVVPGTVLKLNARPTQEEFMFNKWTLNGQDYSTESEITVIINEATDLLAVFNLSSGYNGPAASSIEEVKTIGDVLALPNYGYSTSEKEFMYAFELNGVVYRVKSDISEDTSKALFDLDFSDPDYNNKFNELVAPLEVKQIDNITEKIPSQEELDNYVGKTGADLTNEGWTYYYYNTDEMLFGMNHGCFSYTVHFDGQVEYKEDLDVDEAIKDLKILSIKYDGYGDLFTE